MSGPDRDTVLASLDAGAVASHLGIKGVFRGRWMRSHRCALLDHSSDAFGLARDGRWHCWSCDDGGDLLKLLALGAGLDIRNDFRAVLDIAAQIAGVDAEDDFGAPTRPPAKARPPEPPQIPAKIRVEIARKRAQWVWDSLVDPATKPRSGVRPYLVSRGLDVDAVLAQEKIHETPLRCSPEQAALKPELERLCKMFAVPGFAVAVRSPKDGALVDVRIRRYEPQGEQPKIVGMLGGVTTLAADNQRARELIGCYGFPHRIDHDLVVVVEGLADYLSALCVWPNACVLGAVDAGSMALVVGVAADALAARDATSRILIVEQNDGAPRERNGKMLAQAADRSVNEDVNSAAKVAIRKLGARRVGWLFCWNVKAEDDFGGGGEPVKDLNDLLRYGYNPAAMAQWWSDLGELDA